MRRQLSLLISLVLLGGLFWTPTSFAQTPTSICKVETNAPTLLPGQRVPCSMDTSGNLRVAVGGSGGGFGTNTAVAPSRVEGSPGSFSFDLSGNARVTPGTLLAGEDLTNNLLMVNGGAIELFTLMTGVTTNTTSATQIVYSGGKTFMASVTGTGAVSVTVDIFGDMQSTTTNGQWLCTILPSGTTTDTKTCMVQVTKDFPYYHAVTTNISGTSATVVVQAAVGIVGTPQNEFRTSGNKIADALIKTGPGFLRCVIFSQHDAAPTAGTVSINDATSAGTGTVIVEHVFTTATFMPTQICPETGFTTGLFFDFTTTGDVSTVGSYR